MQRLHAARVGRYICATSCRAALEEHVWQRGDPASASMPSAVTRRASARRVVEMRVDVERVYRLSMPQARASPFGEVAGDTAPIRSTSRWGIARSRLQISSMRRSDNSRGSPPDMITSRISGCASSSGTPIRAAPSNLLGVAHLAPAGAEAAVRGAHRGHQKERAVGIAVRDVGNRRVSRLRPVNHQPSWTSSSCTVGTYCRQMGSPGDLIRSTMRARCGTRSFRRPGGDARSPRRAPDRSARRGRRATRCSSYGAALARSSSQLLGVRSPDRHRARSTPGWSRSWCSRAFS